MSRSSCPRSTRHHFVCPYSFICGVYFLVIILTGCSTDSAAAPEPVLITIAGSSAAQPVLQDLAAAFSQRHPHISFDIRGGESTLAEKQLQAGEVDLAVSALPPSPPTPIVSQPGAPTAPVALVHVPIALDALALIVHPRSKLENLTLLQLRDMYSGRITNWADVEDEESEILLVTREEGSGAWQLFTERVMGDDPMSLTAVVMPGNVDVVDFVAGQPGTIGYVSRAYVTSLLTEGEPSDDGQEISGSPRAQTIGSPATAQTLAEPPPVQANVHILHLENELPTASNLQEQEYHLAYLLYLVSRGAPAGWSREFVDFVLSPAGQSIVGRYHGRVR